ncbi:hypothetical protein BDB01DRAFT_798557 [Pilobolus umbonatus]|nr:hypothetical protein BDB01DRAFT_798557 [Pilobolus umbonatus]
MVKYKINFFYSIKHRRRFSSNETRVLEKEYDKNTSPSQEKIQIIADSINTPRKIVTTWFQNRRAKNKRREKLRKEALNKVNTVGQITDSNDSLDSCGGNTEYAHQDGSPKVILNNTMFESLSPQYHTLSNTMYCREDLESTPFQIPQHRYMLRSNPLSYFPDNSENDNA